jgi:hypothetical protein
MPRPKEAHDGAHARPGDEIRPQAPLLEEGEAAEIDMSDAAPAPEGEGEAAAPQQVIPMAGASFEVARGQGERPEAARGGTDHLCRRAVGIATGRLAEERVRRGQDRSAVGVQVPRRAVRARHSGEAEGVAQGGLHPRGQMPVVGEGIAQKSLFGIGEELGLPRRRAVFRHRRSGQSLHAVRGATRPRVGILKATAA